MATETVFTGRWQAAARAQPGLAFRLPAAAPQWGAAHVQVSYAGQPAVATARPAATPPLARPQAEPDYSAIEAGNALLEELAGCFGGGEHDLEVAVLAPGRPHAAAADGIAPVARLLARPSAPAPVPQALPPAAAPRARAPLRQTMLALRRTLRSRRPYLRAALVYGTAVPAILGINAMYDGGKSAIEQMRSASRTLGDIQTAMKQQPAVRPAVPAAAPQPHSAPLPPELHSGAAAMLPLPLPRPSSGTAPAVPAAAPEDEVPLPRQDSIPEDGKFILLTEERKAAASDIRLLEAGR